MSSSQQATVEFASVREALSVYACALLGRRIPLRATGELIERGLGWHSPQQAATDGIAVYLPDAVDLFDEQWRNFSWMKVLLTHQLAEVTDDPSGQGWGAFAESFARPDLAMVLLVLAHGARLDAGVLRRTPGLAADYALARQDCLGRRPPFEGLGRRDGAVEWLVQASMGQPVSRAPSHLVAFARQVAPWLATVSHGAATGRTCQEAARKLYDAVSTVAGAETGEGYCRPAAVAYRGDAHYRLREFFQDPEVMEETPEYLRQRAAEVLRDGMEGDRDIRELPDPEDFEDMVDNIIEEAERRQSCADKDGNDEAIQPADGCALELDGPGTHVYDEWDFRGHRYLPDFCLLREKDLGFGDDAFFAEVVERRGALVEKLRRCFEQIPSTALHKERWQREGERLDLDAMIEAAIDMRRGATPSEHVYWRHAKKERSVATAFLLDMSASTREEVTAAGAGDGAAGQRVIDVEREAIVLLVAALERVGDAFGVYGFSGYGRRNVEFYTVKGLDEATGSAVRRRIDRISPHYATRMGPAVRHACAKLLAHPAQTRNLVVIGDGRPQDADYGRGQEDAEYAVHDTRMALLEARQRGIQPVCISVDRYGHDYLRAMMHGMKYELVPDVALLPERLAQIYAALAA